MEQSKTTKPVKRVSKRKSYSVARLSKDFMRSVSRLAEKANRKRFGRRIRPKDILESLFSLADEKLLEKAIKKAQENSLSLGDRREAFLKERLSQFNGSKEQMELKMMEIFDQYLSENQT